MDGMLEPRKLSGQLVELIEHIAWANDEAADSQKIIVVHEPVTPVYEYEIIVYNPSTETDLTVKVFSVEDLEGAIRIIDAYVTSWLVPKSQAITGTTINCYKTVITGIFNSRAIKIVISNDDVIGAAGAFEALVKIKEIR